MTETVHHYQGEAGRRYHHGKRGIPAAAFPWIAQLRAAKFSAYVRSTDVVFEFGVGAGWNLAALTCARRIGHDIAGFLEPELERRGVEFVPTTQQLESGVADVVICHHALEHVLEPGVVLKELHRVLRAGGTLLLAVPFERERRYRCYRPAEPNHHLYSWNPQTLGNLVVETGFELRSIELGQFGYDRFAAGLAHRFHLGERGFRLIRTLAHALRPGREVRVVADSKSSICPLTDPQQPKTTKPWTECSAP
jgi:SAM-dependent methyltransferase